MLLSIKWRTPFSEIVLVCFPIQFSKKLKEEKSWSWWGYEWVVLFLWTLNMIDYKGPKLLLPKKYYLIKTFVLKMCRVLQIQPQLGKWFDEKSSLKSCSLLIWKSIKNALFGNDHIWHKKTKNVVYVGGREKFFFYF